MIQRRAPLSHRRVDSVEKMIRIMNLGKLGSCMRSGKNDARRENELESWKMHDEKLTAAEGPLLHAVGEDTYFVSLGVAR